MQTKSNNMNIKSNHTKQSQITSTQLKANQIKPNQTQSNQLKPNQIKANQITSTPNQHQIRSTQLNIKSKQTISKQTKPK